MAGISQTSRVKSYWRKNIKFMLKECLFLIDQTWKLVSEVTIRNCYGKANVVKISVIVPEESPLSLAINNEDFMEWSYGISKIVENDPLSFEQDFNGIQPLGELKYYRKRIILIF